MTDGHQEQCARYTRDGARCENLTAYLDRWCRACDGFARARPGSSPEAVGTAIGTAKHVALTGSLETDLELDEVDEVRVSQHARDAFRYHHGGSDTDASTQLRSMLEDLLLKSARRIDATGFLSLACDGYGLTVSPDRMTLVEYRTVHRERTWAQFRGGIPSRFGKVAVPRPVPPRVEHGAAVPPDVFAEVFDPATTRVTQRAMAECRAHHGDETAGDVQARLASLSAAGPPLQREDGAFVFTDAGLEYWVSPDATALMRLSTP